jgi:hypothetical protein
VKGIHRVAEKDILSLRLECITLAQERSRTAFFAAVIAAAVVLIVFFNVTLSLTSHTPTKPDNAPHDLVYEALEKEQVKHFFDHFFYSLPVLGVQVSTDDLSLFGPLALLVFSLYYTSCLRSALVQLRDLRRFLGKARDGNALEQVAVTLKSQVVINRGTSTISPEHPAWFTFVDYFTAGNFYAYLIYLPVLASCAALYADIHGTYFTNAALDPSGTVFFRTLDNGEKAKVVMFEIVGVAVTAIVTVYCSVSAKYFRKIRDITEALTGEVEQP